MYTINASFSSPAVVGEPVVVQAVVAAPESVRALVELDMYDAGGERLSQDVFREVALDASPTELAFTFTPPRAGIFHLRGGVYSTDWQNLWFWQNDGGSVTVAAPLDSPVPAAVGGDSASPPSAGVFHTEGATIVDPQGKPFVALGANVGTAGFLDKAGHAEGHVNDAIGWGWNTIRLTILATKATAGSYVDRFGYQALYERIDAVVREYTGKGLVVMLEAHDNTRDAPDKQAMINELDEFWKAMAAKYRDNTRVWFNLVNEPEFISDEWVSFADRLATTIRSQGAQNIIVVDAPGWGQDIGPSFDPNSRFAYEPSMFPALMSRFSNIVLAQHNYGAYELYTTAEKYSAYLDTLAAAGIPMVSGEFGYTYDGSSTAGGYKYNHLGGNVVFDVNPGRGIGILWWHATNDDHYSLKQDGSAFYSGPSLDSNLSEAGKRLWAIGHPSR